MQNPNEAKVVKFTNIFDFDYTHAYGGVPYLLRAGATQLLPWVIGDHLATHLARQALIRKAPIRDANTIDGKGSDRPLWDDQAILDLKGRIIQDAFVEERPEPVSEQEAYRRKVEELNRLYPNGAAGMATPATPVVTTSVGSDIGNLPQAAVAVDATPSVYQDKQEVIAELTKRGVKFDARSSKATLEKLIA